MGYQNDRVKNRWFIIQNSKRSVGLSPYRYRDGNQPLGSELRCLFYPSYDLRWATIVHLYIFSSWVEVWTWSLTAVRQKYLAKKQLQMPFKLHAKITEVKGAKNKLAKFETKHWKNLVIGSKKPSTRSSEAFLRKYGRRWPASKSPYPYSNWIRSFKEAAFTAF